MVGRTISQIFQTKTTLPLNYSRDFIERKAGKKHKSKKFVIFVNMTIRV